MRIPGLRPDTAIRLYAALLTVLAVAMTAGMVLGGVGVGSPASVAVLAAIALFAETQSVRLTPVFEMSVASVTFIFAAVLFGPLAAVVVAVAGLLVGLWRDDVDQPRLRWLVWTSSRALVAGAAGAAARIGGAHPSTLGSLLAAVAAASAADAAGDLLLTPIPPVIRGNASWREFTRTLV